MIVSTGGNTGAQAATMVIRAMSLGEFSPSEFLRVVWKELQIGLALGALLGTLIAVGSWLLINTFINPETMEAITGRIAIWPAAWTHVHKGQISEIEEKYIATGWFNYETPNIQ